MKGRVPIMPTPTLLVLAAGIGSRYGGLKQIDPVGLSGEVILDYSLFDARRAGFGTVVFVIRREIEAEFRERFAKKFESRFPVRYVFQELDKLPGGHAVPPGRKKPWGTVHAVLMAEDVIRESFAVVNADDFYGPGAYRVLAKYLEGLTGPPAPARGTGPVECAMVGYILRNTLSSHGSVARGVCRASPDGWMVSVEELAKIEADGRGARHTDANGKTHPLTGDEIASMNFWG
jgi:hypothetical protein